MSDFVRTLLPVLPAVSVLMSCWVAGCAPEPAGEPVAVVPAPQLTAARDARITLFGELPEGDPGPYDARSSRALRQHTHAEEGADFDPHVDAAGERIVFASTRHSVRPDLYVKSVDGVAVMQLTADPSSDVQPVFSPDGQRVAFSSNRAGNWDIWVVDVDGRNLVQITDAPSQDVSASWAPDGASLVYCSLPGPGGQWEMWLTDVAGNGRRSFIGYGLFPEWSPSGDTLVYQRARERGGRWFSIWTMELVDGEPRFPTEIAASADYAMILPTWSPDGTLVAYCAVGASAASGDAGLDPPQHADIWVVGADGRGRACLTDGRSANFSPDWAPGGRLYFSSRRDGRENVWSLAPVAPGSHGAGPGRTAWADPDAGLTPPTTGNLSR